MRPGAPTSWSCCSTQAPKAPTARTCHTATNTPSARTAGILRAFARTAIGAGADVVLGSGPHVLRGLELYRRRLIAYSLGNLTGWQNFNTSGAVLSLSALVTVDLSRTGRFQRGEIDSLWLDRIGVPHRDPSQRAAGLIRRLSHSDFRGRMRFARLGTAQERRGRVER